MKIGLTPQKRNEIRTNAYRHHADLDTKLSISAYDEYPATRKHLDDCIEYPTIGLIARKDAEIKHTRNYQYYENKRDVFKSIRVEIKNEVFEHKFNKQLYPDTGKIRKSLIESEQIMYNTVSKRMSGIKKLIFRIMNIV